jgi:hypothetical protein
MKNAHLILSYTVVFIGIVHIMLTARIFNTLNISALWFISGGLMAIFLGFINVLMNHTHGKKGSTIWILSNVLGTIFIMSVIFINPHLRYIIIASVVVPLLVFSVFLNYLRNLRRD